MALVFKTGIIIFILTAMAMYLLQTLTGNTGRRPSSVALRSTFFAFASLSVTQPWVAFFGLGSLTAYFTRQRVFAAGIILFLVVTVPGVSITVMAGSLQLINFSAITASILGLLVGSFFWSGRFRQRNIGGDLPAYTIALILTFISARDSSLTNVLRTVLENLIAYVLPYLLVRNALRDAASIRNTFILVVAAGLTVSTIAIFESVRVWPMYQAYAMRFGTLLNAGVKMRGGMLRASGPSMNPPLSSAILAMCFVTAVAARDIFKTKVGHRIVLAILATGLFMMQSRVGWLGAICGSVGVIVSKRGIKAFAGYVPVLAVVLGAVYVLAQFDAGFANMVGFSADAKGSSVYRDQLSDLGIEIVKAHPLMGQSIAVVDIQMNSLRQGEGIVDFTNGYLAIALFSGIPGLSLFVGSLLLQWYRSQSGKRAARAGGAGSFADMGMGVVICAVAMLPYVPTDYRIILTMILLFALSNAVVTHWHVRPGGAKKMPQPSISGSGPDTNRPALAGGSGS